MRTFGARVLVATALFAAGSLSAAAAPAYAQTTISSVPPPINYANW